MTKHYDAEQRELRRTIEEHLAITRNRSSRPPQSGEYMPEIPRHGRLPEFEVGPSLDNGHFPPSAGLEGEARRRRSLLFVAGGVVGVSALVAAGLRLANGQSAPQPAAAAFPTALAEPKSAPEHTESRPPVESVWVSLSATPHDAEIRLDGRRVSNPYRAAHGRDKVSHYVSVSLNGYQTLERDVSFDQELELKFALDVTSRNRTLGQAEPITIVRQVANKEPVSSLAPVSPPVSTTLPAEESTPAATRPGDDLRGFDARPNKARDIDETDPYKR